LSIHSLRSLNFGEVGVGGCAARDDGGVVVWRFVVAEAVEHGEGVPLTLEDEGGGGLGGIPDDERGVDAAGGVGPAGVRADVGADDGAGVVMDGDGPLAVDLADELGGLEPLGELQHEAAPAGELVEVCGFHGGDGGVPVEGGEVVCRLGELPSLGCAAGWVGLGIEVMVFRAVDGGLAADVGFLDRDAGELGGFLHGGAETETFGFLPEGEEIAAGTGGGVVPDACLVAFEFDFKGGAWGAFDIAAFPLLTRALAAGEEDLGDFLGPGGEAETDL
jgi:hypothetical protein